MVEHLAGAVAARTGLGDLEKSARGNHLAASATGRTSVQTRSGARARSAAGRAATGLADLDFLLHAAGSFLEFDLQIVSQVGAASLFGGTAASAEKVFENPAAPRTEDLAEQIERIVETAAPSAARALEGGIAEAVESRALFGVGQNVISLRDFLEMFLGLGVARIAVRMVLHRELAVAGFDLIRRRAAGDSEDLVGIPAVARRHGVGQAAGPFETKTLAGRRRRSRSL